MTQKAFFFIAAFLIFNTSFCQPVCNEFYYKKFTQKELSGDLDFIREKILNAHINPFTEISKEVFESNIQKIRNALKDGMTQRDFYFLINPIFVQLNDEHSGLNDFCITDSIKNNFRVFPLRFKYVKGKVILTENYSHEKITLGDELIAINDIPMAQITDNCSAMVFGIPEERKPLVIEKLWLYLPKFCYFITDNYKLKFISGNELTVRSQTWNEYAANVEKVKPKTNFDNMPIKFERIKNDGYLTVNSFDTEGKMLVNIWKQKIDSVFTLIKKEKIKNLFIDVSNNGGGNSEVGNILIDYFSGKPYKDYSGKWKKSQEYSALLAKLKIKDDAYEKLKNGDIMLLGQSKVVPSKTTQRFTGQTYIVIGKNTFSSALMFAVIVHDNHLATVVGEIPERGHPNHFGELINFKTPATQLAFWFGVKQWIRPSGKLENNILVPDIVMDLDGKSKTDIVSKIEIP